VIIFPVEGSSGDQQKAIQDSITQDLEDPSNLFVSSLNGVSGGTLFWKANLTSAQQEAVKQNSGVGTFESLLILLLMRKKVSSISVEGNLDDIDDDNFEPNSASSSRLRRRVTYRSTEEYSPSNASIPSHHLWRRADKADIAADQLKSISQPKNNVRLDDFEKYTYDELAGVGSTVYVIDTGANPNHIVRKHIM
jgi:hypothetical protein